MPFVFSKILDKGGSHPVVARLQIQPHNLIQNSTISDKIRNEIGSAYMNLGMRLVRCWDIWEKLDKAQRDGCAEVSQERAPDSRTMPFIIGLKEDTENFLYEAKNFIRDITLPINAAWGLKFRDASEFYDRKPKDISIPRWAKEKFGASHWIAQLFEGNQEWVAEIIKMRNAVEHPGGFSGTLEIRNFEILPGQGISIPRWRRNDDEFHPLVPEIRILCERMLVFAEEVLVAIVGENIDKSFFEIYEIPVDKRRKDCPERFFLSLNAVQTAKLNEAVEGDHKA